MEKKLEKKIFNKYPEIFAQKDLDMEHTCLCWGLECGTGWYSLIDSLCSYIMGYCEYNKQPIPRVGQVKEKFGELVFFIHGGNSFIDGAVSFAEYLSGFICEKCGSMESVTQTKGWIMTRCKKCMKKHHKRQNSWLWNNYKLYKIRKFIKKIWKKK